MNFFTCCQESPLIFMFCLKLIIYHPQLFIDFLQYINNTHKLSSSVFLIITTHPGGSDIKVSACNAGYLGSIPGSGRYPREANGKPTPVFLPEESHGRRSLVGYSPRGCKESDMTEQLHFHFQTFSMPEILCTLLHFFSS